MKRCFRWVFQSLACALLLIFTFPVVSFSQTYTLYGVISNELVTIDTSTGLATSVGTFNNAFTPAGNLTYHNGISALLGVGTFTSSVNLLSFDPATGAATVIAPITLAPFGTQARLMEGLSYNPLDGLLYGAMDTFPVPTSFFSRILVTINPATGVATRVANISGTCQSEADAMSWASGSLFSVDGCPNPNFFYKMNASTGFATSRGVTGVSGLGDMAWDPVNGILFGYNSNRQLMTIDTSNASVSIIGNTHTSADFGGQFMRGVAFVPNVIMERGGIELDAWSDDKRVVVQWEVESEHDFQSFVLERSIDGRGFAKVEHFSVEPRESYTYSDQDCEALGQGMLLYQVRAIQGNGEEVFSKVVEVKSPNINCILNRVWPNPLPQGAPLYLEVKLAINQPIDLQVINALGDVVFVKRKVFQADSNQLKLFLPGLEPGVYLLKVKTNQGGRLVRFSIL